MNTIEADRIHRLALELHDGVSKATREALRESPDGADHSLTRQAFVLEEALAFLERRSLEIAADLFGLSGEADQAAAVRGHVDEVVTLTASARQASRVCEGCGCTDFIACPGGCTWNGDRCSRCAGRRGATKAPLPRRRPRR